MARKIFVNLPIKDLERSLAFFGALGFDFNPQFTNEQGACMVISEDIYVMLLVRALLPDLHQEADRRRAARPPRC